MYNVRPIHIGYTACPFQSRISLNVMLPIGSASILVSGKPCCQLRVLTSAVKYGPKNVDSRWPDREFIVTLVKLKGMKKERIVGEPSGTSQLVIEIACGA